MRIQLWSYNYSPEPSGIAPLSAIWAESMIRKGHEVTVVAAHPHYPQAVWGSRIKPYRERRNGVPILRLPLWIGRGSGLERMRQELSFMTSLGAVSPILEETDVIVAVTPSFPALLPAMISSRVRRIPWVMWLQDILPDGASTTDLLEDGPLLGAARRFERAAYASAERIFVISDAFRRNLAEKGVPGDKMRRIYNPSPVEVGPYAPPAPPPGRARMLVMGNIGHSQGLTELVRDVEASGALESLDATMRLAGHGMAADAVAAEIKSDRIEMLGVLYGEEMERELSTTTLALVTQRSDVTEFNLPSKLMNYMAHGLPVLAIVNPGSECARIVRESGAGWVADWADIGDVTARMREALADSAELSRRGRAGHAFAAEHFCPEAVTSRYETELLELVPAA